MTDLLRPDEVVERVRARVNAARRAVGARPLAAVPELCWAAQDHATAMVLRDFYDFAGPDGIEPQERARKSGGGYAGQIDALILRGHDVPEEAIDDMLADEGCRETLLSPTFCDLGAGMYQRKWTFLFGTGQQAAEAAPPPPPTSAAGALVVLTPPPAALVPSGGSVEIARELAPPPAPALSAMDLLAEELRLRVLDLINHQRDLARLPLCVASPALEQAAQLHSIDMVKRGFFAYETADGRSVLQRGEQAGYRGRMRAVIAQGIDTPEGLCDALLGPDSQHREHLLGPDVRHLGVGMMRARWTVICGTPPAEQDPRHVQRMQQRLNQERQQVGAPPLRLHDALNRAAQAHAADMAQRGYFHFEHGGVGFADQLRGAGFVGPAIPAIARGHDAADGAVEQWLRSEGNRKNVLDPSYGLLGVGVAASHWTVLLAPAR